MEIGVVVQIYFIPSKGAHKWAVREDGLRFLRGVEVTMPTTELEINLHYWVISPGTVLLGLKIEFCARV